MTAFVKKKGIRLIYAQNETKSNYSERAVQTIKNRLYRMFTQKNNYKWVDSLPRVTENINKTPSRPLNERAPADVHSDNEDEVRLDQYLVRTGTSIKPKKLHIKTKKNVRRNRSPYKFKIEDTVRLTQVKSTFQREFHQKWTDEIFKIKHRILRQNIPSYKLTDFNGEDITGSFYEQELQRVDVLKDDVWRIEKVISEKKIRGVPHSLVKWEGWGSRYNSYIPSKDVKQI